MIDQLRQWGLRLLRDESGPTAVEYAVMLALIAAACVGAVGALIDAVAASFTTSSEELWGTGN